MNSEFLVRKIKALCMTLWKFTFMLVDLVKSVVRGK